MQCQLVFNFFTLYLRSLGAIVRGGQVNKTLEIIGLELYCGTFEGPIDLMTVDTARSEGKKCDSILAPFDVSMTLLVCKSYSANKKF